MLNNKPFLIPFKMHQVEYMDLREFDKRVFLSVPNSAKELIAYERSGYAWTGIVGSEIIAAGGIAPIWDGVACAWLLSTPLVDKYKLFLHKTVKNAIIETAKAKNLHRIETAILVEHTVSQRWAERLGFVNEGMMHKFDSKKNDYFRYALILE